MNFNKFPKSVRIVEVGPRDGLQNEKIFIDTKDKFKFIQKLLLTGLKTIEVTSFVKVKKIEQLKDAKDLYLMIKDLDGHFPCLVPNLKGLEDAIDVGVEEIAIFTSNSDTFNKKNINRTVEESMEDFSPLIDLAFSNNIRVRAYVSMAFGCPYEGDISVDRLLRIIKRLIDYGAYEVSIGDTIGCATPKQVSQTLTRLERLVPISKIALHLHNTRGMALANILVGLSHGVECYDASAGGLGGCPYAKGATGNVATDELIYLFSSLGIETGVNLKELIKVSQWILKKIGRESTSQFIRSYQG